MAEDPTTGETEKTPVELAEERVAEAKANLAEAQKAHETSLEAEELKAAKDEHNAAVAAHADLTTQKVEEDKHILVQFAGTTDAVVTDIPDGALRDESGRCRERRLLVGGKSVEHVGEQGFVWVYREM